jgi:CIC family chloride channel protein
VYLRDLERANPEDSLGKYITRGSPSVSLTSTLEHALEVMATNKARWVAVVDKGKLLGIVTYDGIIDAYKRELNAIKNS